MSELTALVALKCTSLGVKQTFFCDCRERRWSWIVVGGGDSEQGVAMHRGKGQYQVFWKVSIVGSTEKIETLHHHFRVSLCCDDAHKCPFLGVLTVDDDVM